MSAEALARVLAANVGPDPLDWEGHARRILADPGPLLAALAEAGVLREERRAACSCVAHDAIPVERRYVTEWQADD